MSGLMWKEGGINVTLRVNSLGVLEKIGDPLYAFSSPGLSMLSLVRFFLF